MFVVYQPIMQRHEISCFSFGSSNYGKIVFLISSNTCHLYPCRCLSKGLTWNMRIRWQLTKTFTQYEGGDRKRHFVLFWLLSILVRRTTQSQVFHNHDLNLFPIWNAKYKCSWHEDNTHKKVQLNLYNSLPWQTNKVCNFY